MDEDTDTESMDKIVKMALLKEASLRRNAARKRLTFVKANSLSDMHYTNTNVFLTFRVFISSLYDY